MACPFTNPSQLFTDLAATRSRPGVEYNEKLSGFVVSRYDDIVSVLDKPDVFSSRPTVPEFPPQVRHIFANKVPDKGTLLAWDNPDHDRLRRSVASFFVPRRLRRFEPVLRATAHDLIDGFVEDGTVEIKKNFALPLPLRTIVAVAGLDPARWEWIGRCLALFGGITRTDEDEELGIEQRVQDVLDLHDYVASVIEERRTDRRDDLISHIWNERDAGNVEMTDYEHLAMIPGLLLAGHETTTNFLSMSLAHLLHYGLWDQVSKSDDTRNMAIEELLRYESAITGMPRLVTEETTLGGTRMAPGDRLFVAYNSGSRDEAKFPGGDRINVERRQSTQHLGFGRGVHACLGAPFARLLLCTELAVIRERLPNLRLVTPHDEMPYTKGREGRGVDGIVVAWDPPQTRATAEEVSVKRGSSSSSSGRASMPGVGLQSSPQDREMVVEAAKELAAGVLGITLRGVGGVLVPEWTPGAHIDVDAGGGLGFRQYSLCSGPSDRQRLEIAVLRDDAGLGASRRLHETVRPGTRLAVRGPRNNFSFEPGQRRTLLIAGGIGITPMLPMAAAAAALGVDYHLVYMGRTRQSLAFADHLEQAHGGRVTVWSGDEHQGARFDLEALLRAEDHRGLRVYCCGPQRLMDAVEAALKDAPPDVLRMERFSNPLLSDDDAAQNKPFDVVLARSGRVLRVPEDKSVLDVVNGAGAGVLSTCNKGLCGTCEVRVLDGLPEHRDAVLTPLEKAEGTTMMACVSRCRGDKLTLDLW